MAAATVTAIWLRRQGSRGRRDAVCRVKGLLGPRKRGARLAASAHGITRAFPQQPHFAIKYPCPRRIDHMMPAKTGQTSKGLGYVPLVEVRRGDVVESLHFGAIAVVDSAGR